MKLTIQDQLCEYGGDILEVFGKFYGKALHVYVQKVPENLIHQFDKFSIL